VLGKALGMIRPAERATPAPSPGVAATRSFRCGGGPTVDATCYGLPSSRRCRASLYLLFSEERFRGTWARDDRSTPTSPRPRRSAPPDLAPTAQARGGALGRFTRWPKRREPQIEAKKISRERPRCSATRLRGRCSGEWRGDDQRRPTVAPAAQATPQSGPLCSRRSDVGADRSLR
jgi:hypothetical protein